MKRAPGRFTRAALILFFIGLAGVPPAEAEIRAFDLRIQDRQVVMDGNVLRVNRGDRVVIRWLTDERVRLHLHGYDIEFELFPGEPLERAFEAHATGRFPVTSHGFGDEHGGHVTLLYLEVYPD